MRTALILLAGLNFSTARAQDPMTVGSALLALEELERTTGQIANQFEFAISSQINSALVGAGHLITALRTHFEGLGLAADKLLTEQQSTMVDNVNAIVDRLNSSADSVLTGIADVNNAVAQTISMIPTFPKEPRVTAFRTGPYVPGWSRHVIVTLRGTNLDHAGNRLMLGSQTHRPSEQGATGVSFTIPARDLDAIQKSAIGNRLPLKVNLKYRSWLVFRKGKDVPLSILMVPKRLGNLEIFYVVDSLSSNREQVIAATCGVTTRGPGPSGRPVEASRSCRYTPPVKVVEACGVNVVGQHVSGSVRNVVIANRHGGRHSVTSESSGGFVVQVTARSDRGPYRGGGSYAVSVRHDVTYPCRVKAEKSVGVHELEVGKPVSISMASQSARRSQFARAILRLADSTELILTRDKPTSRLASVSVNDGLMQVIISALNVERN